MMGDLSKRLRDCADNGGNVPLAALFDIVYEAADALDALEWKPIAEVPPGTRRIIGAVNGHVMGDLYRGDHPWARWLTLEGTPFSPTHFMPLPQPPEGE